MLSSIKSTTGSYNPKNELNSMREKYLNMSGVEMEAITPAEMLNITYELIKWEPQEKKMTKVQVLQAKEMRLLSRYLRRCKENKMVTLPVINLESLLASRTFLRRPTLIIWTLVAVVAASLSTNFSNQNF